MRQAASGRAAVLASLRSPVRSAADIVNYVHRADLSADPLPTGRWQRWRARVRARRPGLARIEFREWVGLPWRDRPEEARLADVAGGIARTIKHHPAWGHSMLEGQRAQFDPAREFADIACAAYRLYLLRREVGPQPSGPGGARTAWDEGMQSWQVGWSSLLDRVAALVDFSNRLDEVAPALAATDTALRLGSGPMLAAQSAAFAGSAADDLRSDEIRALGAGVDGVRDALVSGPSAPITDQPPAHQPPALSGPEPERYDPEPAQPSEETP